MTPPGDRPRVDRPQIDRPAAIRRALRDLVAELGFHGASMSAVAKAAGVATGTAYVHYASKDELVIATYVEIKTELGRAVLAGRDATAPPAQQYADAFRTTYAHMRDVPQRARFLTQLEGSPYRVPAHRRLAEDGDELVAVLVPLLDGVLVPLPQDVVWTMSLGLAIQLAAADIDLDERDLDLLVEATWRAVTVPGR